MFVAPRQKTHPPIAQVTNAIEVYSFQVGIRQIRPIRPKIIEINEKMSISTK